MANRLSSLPKEDKHVYDHAGFVAYYRAYAVTEWWLIGEVAVRPFLLVELRSRRLSGICSRLDSSAGRVMLKYVSPPLDQSVLLIHVVFSPRIAPADLPPLPEIKSATLKTQVFTHRSVYARPTHVFEDSPDDPAPDNEMFVALLSLRARLPF